MPSKRQAPGAISGSSTSVGVDGEVGDDSKLPESMLLALKGISETVELESPEDDGLVVTESDGA